MKAPTSADRQTAPLRRPSGLDDPDHSERDQDREDGNPDTSLEAEKGDELEEITLWPEGGEGQEAEGEEGWPGPS